MVYCSTVYIPTYQHQRGEYNGIIDHGVVKLMVPDESENLNFYDREDG